MPLHRAVPLTQRVGRDIAAGAEDRHITSLTQPPVPLPVLDPVQLRRIEAVHRGYLYQHLYAVQCLLRAGASGATSVIVEGDEDVEIVFEGRRVYVQVKHRAGSLAWGDIASAIDRFAELREAHARGDRDGEALFVIVCNAAPNGPLADRITHEDWPDDVTVLWGGVEGEIVGVPDAPVSLTGAYEAAHELAGTVPLAMLAPDTLVWKLAGLVTMASTGETVPLNHVFVTTELPALFEQLIIQLQSLPAPPPVYRVQVNEPALVAEDRVRLITGHSGAGKTSWVAQSAQHAGAAVVYLDIGDVPGPNLTHTVAREMAARLFTDEGGLARILIPGASGRDILRGIGRRVADAGSSVTLVLDNVHVASVEDVLGLVQAVAPVSVILLARPHRVIEEIEAIAGVAREDLNGWSIETVAEEAAANGCRIDPRQAQALLDLTGGLPLYIQNAVSLSRDQYGGSVGDFVSDLSAATHVVETAQEIILGRAFDGLEAEIARTAELLCLIDVPVTRTEAVAFLTGMGRQPAATHFAFRRLRAIGVLQIFGGDRIKIHDAARVVGKARLAGADPEVAAAARLALHGLIIRSLRENWSYAKLGFFLRLTAQVGKFDDLVNMSTDEHFHELGLWAEIEPHVEAVAADEARTPIERVTALDGLIFADLKYGTDQAGERLELMEALIRDHDLGWTERLRAGMKRMSFLANAQDRAAVTTLIPRLEDELKDAPDDYQRVFRYNAALALLKIGAPGAAAETLSEVVAEYYDILGISPDQVMGKNSDALRPLLRDSESQLDDIKHLADSLDALAQAANAMGRHSGFARIHALKFYEMAQSRDSLLRVGQDLVDEFVSNNDFTGARQFLETTLLQQVAQFGLADHLVSIRSVYAVVLAYDGDFDAAEREIARLAPFEEGLALGPQTELRDRRALIAQIRRDGPPPKFVMPANAQTLYDAMLGGLTAGRATAVPKQKQGRNDPCSCGSGRKFKKCCL